MSDLDYYAGFMEGDGCISVMNKHTRYPMLLLQIGQCRSKTPLDLFQLKFGGAIYEDKHRSPITKAHKIYKYTLTGDRAICMFNLIKPFLRFRAKIWQEKVDYYLEHRIGDMVRGRPYKKPTKR